MALEQRTERGAGRGVGEAFMQRLQISEGRCGKSHRLVRRNILAP
jgi:hypothetical protein